MVCIEVRSAWLPPLEIKVATLHGQHCNVQLLQIKGFSVVRQLFLAKKSVVHQLFKIEEKKKYITTTKKEKEIRLLHHVCY